MSIHLWCSACSEDEGWGEGIDIIYHYIVSYYHDERPIIYYCITYMYGYSTVVAIILATVAVIFNRMIMT
jgi:hypothetical protein